MPRHDLNEPRDTSHTIRNEPRATKAQQTPRHELNEPYDKVQHAATRHDTTQNQPRDTTLNEPRGKAQQKRRDTTRNQPRDEMQQTS
jgi:hypothetical protein